MKLLKIKHIIDVFPKYYNYKFVLCIGKHMWLFGREYTWSLNNTLGFNCKKMYAIYIWQKIPIVKKRKIVYEPIRFAKHFVFSPLPLMGSDFDGDLLNFISTETFTELTMPAVPLTKIQRIKRWFKNLSR